MATRGKQGPAYDPKTHPARAGALAAKGCSRFQIAKGLKVSRPTVIQWESEHAEFQAALEAGWEAATDLAEHALYRLAVGFNTTETKTTPAEPLSKESKSERTAGGRQDKQSAETATDPPQKAGRRRTTCVRTRKQVPPEYRATVLWLTKRRPQVWGEGVPTTHPMEAEGDLDFSGVSVAQVVEALEKLSG